LSAAALILLAACSSGGSGPASSAGPASTGSASAPLTPRQALLAAAAQARQIRSATETLTVQQSGSESATTTGTIQVRLKPTLQASETLRTALAGKTTQIKAIVTSTVIYLHEASLTRQFGKPWLKVRLSALSGTAGGSFAQLFRSLQSNNVTDQTQLLTVAKDTRVVGRQTVGGVPTTEYAGSFRAAEGLKSLPGSLRKALAPAFKALGNSTIRFHIWLDGQHRPRKVTEVETVNGETINTTVNITALNSPVHITIPPASQAVTPPGL
jgi:hypothetical protein